MISIYDGTIQDLLRNGMQHAPEVQALAYAILQEKRRIIDKANRTRTLSVVDELPEDILDLLSVELRTPFYDEGFPIETKRELIKRTFIFYQYMGTPESVNQMLDSAYPGSCIEEWFFYGGDPFHFQVVIETTRARQTAVIPDITRAVEKCKRLAAHSDGIIFQCAIGVTIGTNAHGFRYNSISCGQRQSGTVPWRSTRSGIGHGEMEAETRQDIFKYNAPLTGTKPWRNTSGAAEPDAVVRQIKRGRDEQII